MQAGLFGPDEEPFARRATSLLTHVLQELAQAADTGRVAELADRARHPGISANLCEALLMLRPSGAGAYLGISVTWSRTFLPVREALPETQLRQEVFEVVGVVASRLKEASGV